MMVPYLTTSDPIGTGPNGDQIVNPYIIRQNTSSIQSWGNSVGVNLYELMARVDKLEEMIKWIGAAYPEVIAGYKAIKDIENEAV